MCSEMFAHKQLGTKIWATKIKVSTLQKDEQNGSRGDDGVFTEAAAAGGGCTELQRQRKRREIKEVAFMLGLLWRCGGI